MSVPETVFLGHSHSYAILSAYDDARGDLTGPLRIHRFFLMDPEYDPILPDDFELNPRLGASLSRVLGERPVRAGFLTVDGNAHTLFALVKHPRPFDFVLEEAPDLPLDPDSEVVPEAFVEGALRHRLGRTDRLIGALRRHLPIPLFHVESVPPVRSSEHILQTKEQVFWETLRLGELGVAPAFLRWKLWRLHSRLVQEICRRHDVTFIAAPREAQDDDGFMVDAACSPGDATHGNSWYGTHVLRQMAEAVQALGGQ